MAQPTEWVIAGDYSVLSPGDLGNALEAEFLLAKTTQDEIRTNLALIQRDDGGLKNGIVTQDSLADSLFTGVGTPDNWATATAYVVNDSVIESGNWYLCLEAHTSGTFATDLAATKWRLLINLTTYQTVSDTSELDAGTVLLPGLIFAGDTNSGWYTTGGDIWNLSINGAIHSSNTTAGFTLSQGVFISPVGAAATPSYSFTGDLNTGMYRKGADQLGFATAGVERVYIAADGTLNATKIKEWVKLGDVETVADGDYTFTRAYPQAATIINAKTVSESGTCTATFKIGAVALGGTANSVSSTAETQAHASANVVAADDALVVTISANAACVNAEFWIQIERAL